MPSIIYLIENTINSKFYIGKTERTVKHRWSEHVGYARRGSLLYFHRAIQKYGADAFAMKVLETVDDPGVLNEREMHWIATLEPDYNLTAGGEGITGFKHSDAAKQKMREAGKRRKHSAATKQKIGVAGKGRKMPPRSAEHCQKISDAKRGRKQPPGRKMPPRSAEHCQKISDANTGLKHSAATKQKMSDAGKGRKKPPRSAEHCQKISDAKRGRKHSAATKQKISDANTGLKRSDKARQNYRDAWKLRLSVL